MSWFALTTKVKSEDRACNNLQAQGFNCFLPKIKQLKIVRGIRTTATEPLFSRYLFIQLNEFEQSFRSVSNTRGIAGFVRFGTHFAKVDERVISYLKQRHNPDQLVEDKSVLRQNDLVEILDGPFKNMHAIYQSHNGDERAMVLVQILQQQIKLTVENRLLRKAG